MSEPARAKDLEALKDSMQPFENFAFSPKLDAVLKASTLDRATHKAALEFYQAMCRFRSALQRELRKD